MNQLELDTALGDGASGDVFAAKFKGRDVAVKVFKAETSPDGHARDEIAVTCHVDHPNLIKVCNCNHTFCGPSSPHHMCGVKVTCVSDHLNLTKVWSYNHMTGDQPRLINLCRSRLGLC